MKHLKTAFLLTCVLFMASGCLGRAIKEGIGTVKGARGVYRETSRPTNLRAYSSFEVGRFTDDFGGMTPPQLLSLLPTEVRMRLRENEIPVGPSAKSVLIRGRVFYYEQAGITGQVFGPFEEAITDVELVDQATGRVIGKAICIGRTTESVNQGVEEKAQGVAKAIADWIKKQYIGE